jgi:hypothetical protein
MDKIEYERRRELTFEQAEGISPLPAQLNLREIPVQTKALLWAAVFAELQLRTSKYGSTVFDPILTIARRHFIQVEHGMIDEFRNDFERITKRWKEYFTAKATYTETLGFVQWLLRERPSDQFAKKVEIVLESTRTAYRVVNNDTIMQVASAIEAEAVTTALKSAKHRGIDGSRQHLLDASAALTGGDYATSIRESMSAVESVCLSVTGVKDFAKAVAIMDAKKPMHPAFKIAINRLYDFTSQEPGLRHAKRHDATANVDERDAIFMIGVCASFVTYMLAE